MKRIHILGASGSGTTTLAEALSDNLGYRHFDTDGYFWERTNPPFQHVRDIGERQSMLKLDLERHSDWVLSGSLCGWGDLLIPHFDLVIFLWIPPEVRLQRLHVREEERYGNRISPEGDLYKTHKEFIEWASSYDDGDMNMRSLLRHNDWLRDLECPVLRLEGTLELDEKIERIKTVLNV